MKYLIALLLVTLSSPSLAKVEAKEEYSAQLIKLALEVTDREAIDKLTKNDIPAEWETTVSISEEKDLHIKTYQRGKDTLLTVSWFKQEYTRKNPKYKDFYSIQISHKGNRVAKITNIDSTDISPLSGKFGYSVNTHILKNKEINLVIQGPNGWLEAIELNGIQTTLTDDLTFTKQKLLLGKVRKLIDHAISEEKPDSN